jgi:hypothetical protein
MKKPSACILLKPKITENSIVIEDLTSHLFCNHLKNKELKEKSPSISIIPGPNP